MKTPMNVWMVEEWDERLKRWVPLPAWAAHSRREGRNQQKNILRTAEVCGESIRTRVVQYVRK